MNKGNEELIPIWDFMILKHIEGPKSEIIKPDTYDPSKDRGERFEVIRVGPKCRRVKVGDGVVTASNGGIGAFEFNGEKVHLSRETAVAVVIRKKVDWIEKLLAALWPW